MGHFPENHKNHPPGTAFFPFRPIGARLRLLERLLLALIVATMIGLVAGSGLAAWQAARSIRVELVAALANARADISAMPPPSAPSAARWLAELCDSFDGNRHIQARITDQAGRVLRQSQLAAGPRPPAWFLHATTPPMAPVTLAPASLPAGWRLHLQADATNEAAERWGELRVQIATITLLVLLIAGSCCVIMVRGLRPLATLSNGYARIAAGDEGVELPESGPADIAAQAASFNRMAQALRTATAQNRHLQDQLARVAEEERADIARDLHDEVGPLLFGITTFAATLARSAAEGRHDAIPAQVRAIQDATGSIQRTLRAILQRLHGTPGRGLPEALEAIVLFWNNVAPHIIFTLSCDPSLGTLDGAERDALFHVAQEAVCNAARHGHPSRIALRAGRDGGRIILSVRDDGTTGPSAPGLGLAGMCRRLSDLGGHLDIRRDQGWTVTASLPDPDALPPSANTRTMAPEAHNA
ncbi:HAMP domain-containing protein [Gluconacetobacter aggeris]|uniref:histidine kinase n=1 Tax=Gluconacetobacter aggeris TaxID=1286186 RepID=A0A7W4NX47_9PROT|nr:histidine kinase [Gluconacetobacter aggeris]MBB2169229.1 HAMP domain-containing protein [Gluconacetobacter aggeris]